MILLRLGIVTTENGLYNYYEMVLTTRAHQRVFADIALPPRRIGR